jgi:hypothetical protein
VPTPDIHTVVTGGMAGWQITLIAAGTAPLTATLAVLLDRARGTRRDCTFNGVTPDKQGDTSDRRDEQ